MAMIMNQCPTRQRQTGLSLIELMIALALGVVLTLGVAQIFLGSAQTYRLNDSIALLQENMRFGLGKLQYETRLAGQAGCLPGNPTDQLNPLDAGYDPVVYGPQSVIGWDADGTGLGDQYLLDTFAAGGGSWTNAMQTPVLNPPLPGDVLGRVIEGNDVLLVKGAALLNVILAGNPGAPANTINTAGNSNINQGSILLVIAADCSAGDMFQKTNAFNSAGLTKGAGGSPGNANPATSPWSANYDNAASVYEFQSTAYYIGVGADGEPALYRDRLDAGDPFGRVELISGVENMQVLYGVVANPTADLEANVYLPASQVTDWEEVVSVRIALLMRSGDRVVDEAEIRRFNVAGTEMVTEQDRRSRLVGVATVGIRNALQ